MELFKRNKEQTQAPKTDLSHSKVTPICHKLGRLLGKKRRQASNSNQIQGESSRDSSADPDLGSRPPSKHEDAAAFQSLWDHAYDALRKKEQKLVEEYEELLKNTISPSQDGPTQDEPPGGSTDRRFRQVQLNTIIREGLKRIEEKKTKYTIVGREIDLSDQIDHAASLVLWGKDLISEAVKQSPEASIIWAGVCIILPLLTTSKISNEAQQNGFDYVTTRMRYYTGLEPLLQRLSRSREVSPEVSNHIVQLYERIIEFQIRSVLRFFKSSLKRYVGDVLQTEDWKKMVDDIKEFEGIVDRTLTQPNQLIARQELESLRNNSEDSLTKMQQLLSVSKEQLAISQRGLKIQEEEAKKKLSDEENECHQLFRLTDTNKDVTYEWYKDRVELRIDGTCEWFLNHENFQRWLGQDSGPLLVSADPGCGKSVLAKYLIDRGLFDRGLKHSTTICYFFFKDQDQNTSRQALCALLHQLFSIKPFLIEHAMKQFKKDGSGLINSTSSLWTVLENAVQDPQAGPIIIVLDALDECDESEFEDVMRNIDRQFRSNQSSSRKLKYLLTSRPYEQIVSKFQSFLDAFPYVRIPGEEGEESEIIGQEVNQVIKRRVEDLAKEKRLSDEVKDHLAERLLKIPHRTYLWAYLVFDYLKKESFKKTRKGVDSTMETLPKNIHQAYEKILSKCKKEEESTVRKALSIILIARRPLTILEMNVALNVDNTSKSIHDLDLEEEEDFKLRLRSWCGLFVSIHHGKVYFLHQTAREFLLRAPSPETTLSEGHWRHSITSRDAHRILVKICVIYLDFLNHNGTSMDGGMETDKDLDSYTLLDYAAKNWSVHFLEARVDKDADIIPYTLRICDTDLRSCSTWLEIYWSLNSYRRDLIPLTSLTVSSYLGHEVVVRLLLENGADIESKNEKSGASPLLWAAERGHAEVVKLLLENGADIESKNEISGTSPLSWAAELGHTEVVKLLLENGANLESKRKWQGGLTPLSWAAQEGHTEVVKLLLEKGANLESGNGGKNGLTPLSWAVQGRHTEVVKLLLEKGAKCEPRQRAGDETPLLYVARKGFAEIVELLLEAGSDYEYTDTVGNSPIEHAVMYRHFEVFKLLVEKGAKCEYEVDLLREYFWRKKERAEIAKMLESGIIVAKG